MSTAHPESSAVVFPDEETRKVPAHAACQSPNHKGPRDELHKGACSSPCEKCGKFTCSSCEGTDRLPELCDACWSDTVKDVCYRCEKTEEELNAQGRQLYFCEAKRGRCPNQCCADCSETETEPDTGSSVVYCLECSDRSHEDEP